jgi:hypothetical protein
MRTEGGSVMSVFDENEQNPFFFIFEPQPQGIYLYKVVSKEYSMRCAHRAHRKIDVPARVVFEKREC